MTLPRRPFLTTRAHDAFGIAHDIADRLGHDVITPVHVSLGVVREGRSVAAGVLLNRGVPLDDLEKELAAQLPPAGTPRTPVAPRAWTPTDEGLIAQAAAEARELGTVFFGCEHLLLAMLRDTASPCARTFARHGIHLDDARAEVLRIYEGRPDVTPREPTRAVQTLLQALMPKYDVAERHHTIVRAPATRVYAAIREANLAGGALTRALLALRAAPAALLAIGRGATQGERAGTRGIVRLSDFERAGFRIVAERAPQELVVGLLGRFWTPRGGLAAQVSGDTFRAGPPRGQALAGWNFTVAERPDGSTDLRTETRVWCSPESRWKFRLYWLAVRPGSGLIRRAMLREIRRHAERQA